MSAYKGCARTGRIGETGEVCDVRTGGENVAATGLWSARTRCHPPGLAPCPVGQSIAPDPISITTKCVWGVYLKCKADIVFINTLVTLISDSRTTQGGGGADERAIIPQGTVATPRGRDVRSNSGWQSIAARCNVGFEPVQSHRFAVPIHFHAQPDLASTPHKTPDTSPQYSPSP
jgi:hypothetical protein